MTNLKQVLATLNEKEAESLIDPTAVDPRVRAGVEANVRNAKVELDKLQRQYKDAVMNNVVVIAVKGKTAEQFAQAAEKAGAIAMDFQMIVKRLASNLKNRAVGETYTSDANFKLIDELSKLRIEYDIVQLPNPTASYNDGVYEKPLLEAITALFTKNYGNTLQCAVTRREIGNRALAAKFSGKKLPVILYNLSEDVDTKFIPAATATITSDAKVTDNAVKKKLTEIRNTLISKESQTTGQSAQTQGEQ